MSSCTSDENPSLFSTDSKFAGYTCVHFSAFLGFAVLNALMSYISIFIRTRRSQQQRMIQIHIPRYINGKENPEWRSHFYSFIFLVGLSNIIYLINFLLIATSNIYQMLIMVIASMTAYFFMYELNMIEGDADLRDVGEGRIDLNIMPSKKKDGYTVLKNLSY